MPPPPTSLTTDLGNNPLATNNNALGGPQGLSGMGGMGMSFPDGGGALEAGSGVTGGPLGGASGPGNNFDLNR